MDTDKCRVLVSVIEAGNIRGTAEQLGYTPSGISRMIRSLETELGLTLLERERTGVKPTTQCAQLLPLIRRVAACGQQLENAADGLLNLESGTLRIGIAYPSYQRAIIGVLERFHAAHPKVDISLVQANSTPLVRALDNGELDFCIVSERPGNHDWFPLTKDYLVALVPASHELALDGGTYPLERFATDPYIQIGPDDTTDNLLVLSSLNVTPNVCYSVSNDEAAYQLVDAGLGVTLTNQVLAQTHEGSAVQLAVQPETSVTIGIVTPQKALASAAARAFTAEVIRELAYQD